MHMMPITTLFVIDHSTLKTLEDLNAAKAEVQDDLKFRLHVWAEHVAALRLEIVEANPTLMHKELTAKILLDLERMEDEVIGDLKSSAHHCIKDAVESFLRRRATAIDEVLAKYPLPNLSVLDNRG